MRGKKVKSATFVDGVDVWVGYDVTRIDSLFIHQNIADVKASSGSTVNWYQIPSGFGNVEAVFAVACSIIKASRGKALGLAMSFLEVAGMGEDEFESVAKSMTPILLTTIGGKSVAFGPRFESFADSPHAIAESKREAILQFVHRHTTRSARSGVEISPLQPQRFRKKAAPRLRVKKKPLVKSKKKPPKEPKAEAKKATRLVRKGVLLPASGGSGSATKRPSRRKNG